MGCSSVNTPKYLTEVIRFISLSFINNDGSFKGILSFSRALWKNVYLVLSLFRDNLFALSHLKTLFSSKLAVWKSSSLFLWEKNRFASSANIMGSSISDTLNKSFTHIMTRNQISHKCITKIFRLLSLTDWINLLMIKLNIT